MSFLRIALVTVPAIVLAGTVSGLLSNSGDTNSWYRALDLPSFQPPSWAFGVVWPILYICLGLSLAMLLHARGAVRRGRLIALFLIQLALNFAWSPIFFGLHKVELGLAILAAMVVLTLALIALLWRVRVAAALLLLPYLAWICFATALNFQIMVDNPIAERPNAERVAPRGANTDIPLD